MNESLSQQRVHPNIPNKGNSPSGNVHIGWHICKTWHVIENMFATLKYLRSLAVLYNKLKNS